MSDPHRHKDEDFLEYTREQKCAVCLSPPPSDPHHMVTRGAGGSDLTCIPLCRECHNEIGNVGLSHFEKRHRVNLWKQQSRHLRRYMTNTHHA